MIIPCVAYFIFLAILLKLSIFFWSKELNNNLIFHTPLFTITYFLRYSFEYKLKTLVLKMGKMVVLIKLLLMSIFDSCLSLKLNLGKLLNIS